MTTGHATSDGTSRYCSRFPPYVATAFYRSAQDLTVSSLGLGTYLGGADDKADRGYIAAVQAAIKGGINLFDTAINYRHQRSERAIGAALHELFNADELQRDEIVVCTKAGFLTPHAVPSWLGADQIVGGVHSMNADFLADQIDRSRENLKLDTIDVFYLHNPEMQLEYVTRPIFHERCAAAFDRLEQLVSERKIQYYGMATWEGLRKQPDSPERLELGRLVEMAQQAGGEKHHFRFIQLPYNLAMVETFTQKGEPFGDEEISVLDAAQRYGLTVIASATLMQGRLTKNLPEAIGERLAGLESDTLRAIQFTRSTPGITAALVGMGRPEHVEANIRITATPPASRAEYQRLFQ